MTINVDGTEIATSASGFLESLDDWSEDVAAAIAADEKIDMTEKHWDVVNYLREEFINNGGNQPNTRNMVKALGKQWGEKISAKNLYDLFPGDPSKQAGRIGGLPESRRKGGY